MISARFQTDRMVLHSVPRLTLDALRTREERLAFWINAYNALVAEGIQALGIRQSVWEVPDFFARICSRIGGLVFSADEVEHGVLRGNRPSPLARRVPFPVGDPRRPYAITPLDPRIHFAISCGARSCPPVRIYHPRGLDEQLDAATRAFLEREVTLDGESLMASELFKWFREDFDDFPEGLVAFLARYLQDGAVRRAVLEQGVEGMTWRTYDWRLQLPVPTAPDGGGHERWTAPA